MSFNELQSRVFQLYGEGKLAETIAVIVEATPHYPEEAHTLWMWRIGLHSAMGEIDTALRLCDEVVAQGIWFAVDYLRSDPDFKPLEGKESFERLVAYCHQRRDEAAGQAKPFCLTLPPARTAGPLPLVMAMHGNGNHPEREVGFWQTLPQQGWLLAMPQSTQVSGPRSYIWTDHAQGFRDVTQYAAEVTAAHDVDPGRVVLGGFSMGAGLSIRLALTGAIRARGFIAVGPYLPEDIAQLRRDLEQSRVQGVRGYLVLGGGDEAAVKLGQEIVDLMAEFGLECRQEVHPGLGHWYPADFAASLEKALAFILA